MVHTGSPNSCYYVANVQDGEENKVCIPEPEYYMDLGFENQVYIFFFVLFYKSQVGLNGMNGFAQKRKKKNVLKKTSKKNY